MKIHFLKHSGFACEGSDRIYIFDYWKDPTHVLEALQQEGKPLWFFVTHIHGDHYNKEIARFDSSETVYVLHKDIRNFSVAKGKIIYMDVGDMQTIEDIEVTMYGSTDEGGSYTLALPNGKTLFHAGDFNWWHWLGDTDENNEYARNFFEEQLRPMKGMEMDIAFFPVDSRLEAAREWGLMEWLSVVTVKELFIPMHMHDLETGGWNPSAKFKEAYPILPIWIPQKEGETKEVR